MGDTRTHENLVRTTQSQHNTKKSKSHHDDPHYRSAKELRSFDFSKPLYYISTKRIKANTDKKVAKHKSMKSGNNIHHHGGVPNVSAKSIRQRPKVKMLPLRSRLYY